MARKKNSKLAALLFGPILVIGGSMALWQNEGRFDYYAAARDARVIAAPAELAGEPIAYTDRLRTDIPIAGDYVTALTGYHVVYRSAEIYSWDESTDSDGNTTWSRGWHSRLESNARNSGLSQRLSSTRLYPYRYELGTLVIEPRDIHFVDERIGIPIREMALSPRGVSLGLRASADYFYLDKGRSDGMGDERVSYRAIPNSSEASYFGTISGGRGVRLQLEKRDGLIADIIADDGILHHLVNGDRETALAKIKADLVKKRWLVRIGGTIAIVLGFFVFFSVFASLLYRIPVIGKVVESGVFLLSLTLGISLALLLIVTGLLFHNPLTLALPLALLVGGIIWLLRRSSQASRNAKSALEQRLAAQRPPESRLAPPEPPPSVPPIAATGRPQEALIPEEGPVERTFIHLAALAMADGQLSKKELKLLGNWAGANRITPSQMKTLVALAERDPAAAGEATRDDLELLALMALTDGSVSTAEWAFLNRIAAKLGLTKQDLQGLLHDIETGKLLPA